MSNGLLINEYNVFGIRNPPAASHLTDYSPQAWQTTDSGAVNWGQFSALKTKVDTFLDPATGTTISTALDSLGEIQTFLANGDGGFGTAIVNSLGLKADKATPIFTGDIVFKDNGTDLNTIGSIAGASGNTSFSGTLTIGGNTTLSGNLAVTGSTVFSNNVSIVDTKTFTVGTGAAAFGGTVTLSAAPASDLQAATKKYVDDTAGSIDTSTLAPKASPTFTGTMTLPAAVSSATATVLTLTDNAAKPFTISSAGKNDILSIVTTDSSEGVAMSGTLTVTGALSASSTATITGNTTVGGTLGVTGVSTLAGITGTGTINLTGGTTTVAAPTANTHASTKKYVDDTVGAIDTSALAPKAGPTFTGTVTTDVLTSGGAFTASAAATITGALTASSTATISGNTTVGGTLGVTGVSTLAGITGTGTINLTGGTTTVATPTADTHASTKAYVDQVAQGLDVKESCRATTTANITLNDVQDIDGVTLVADDRVLVKNQTTASENGIYVVVSGGDWTRATDFDGSDVTSGAFTFVEEGTTNANVGFTLSTTGAITIGTTNLAFTQFSSAGTVTAGTGLSKSGNTLSVDAAQTGITSVGTLAGLTATGTINLTGGTTTVATPSADTHASTKKYVDDTVGAIDTSALAPKAGPTFTGTVTTDVLTSGGAFTASSTAAITGALTASSTAAISGNTTVGGTLGVTGATTLTGALTASSTAAITGNTTVGGTLGVTGVSTLAGITGTGTINLTGGTTTVKAPSADTHASTKKYVDDTVGAVAALDSENALTIPDFTGSVKTNKLYNDETNGLSFNGDTLTTGAAASANTANAIVKRDANGNFVANTITTALLITGAVASSANATSGVDIVSMNNRPTMVYVDSNRSDTYTENGSRAAPYKTLNSAMTAKCADGETDDLIFTLAPGTYTENIMIKKLAKEQKIHIRGEGEVILQTGTSWNDLISKRTAAKNVLQAITALQSVYGDGTDDTATELLTVYDVVDKELAVLFLTGFNGVTVENLTFRYTTWGMWLGYPDIANATNKAAFSTRAGVYLDKLAVGGSCGVVKVLNCCFKNCGSSGNADLHNGTLSATNQAIYFAAHCTNGGPFNIVGGQDVEIKNNYIYECVRGIRVDNVNGGYIMNNRVERILDNALYCAAHQPHGTATYAGVITLVGELYQILPQLVNTSEYFGCRNIHFQNNVVNYAGANGILLIGGGHNTFFGNVIRNCWASAIHVTTSFNNNFQNNNVFNCNWNDNNGTGSAADNVAQIIIDPPVNDLTSLDSAQVDSVDSPNQDLSVDYVFAATNNTFIKCGNGSGSSAVLMKFNSDTTTAAGKMPSGKAKYELKGNMSDATSGDTTSVTNFTVLGLSSSNQ